MKTKASLAVLTLLLGFTPLLHAQRVEITPFYGYRFGGEVENALTGRTYAFQDSPAYGLVLGFTPVPDSYEKFELYWSHQDTSVDLQGTGGIGRLNLSIDEIMLGGVLEKSDGHFRPYISGHVGATHFSPEGYSSDTRFGLSLGGGLKFFITRNIAVGADLRGFCTVVNSSGSFISGNGGTVVVYSGSTMWQGQASAGVTIAF